MTNTDKLIVADYVIKSAARGDYLKKTLNALINRGANATPQNAVGAIQRLDRGLSYPLQKVLPAAAESSGPSSDLTSYIRRIVNSAAKRRHTPSSSELGNIFGRTIGPDRLGAMNYGRGIAAKAETAPGNALASDPNFYSRAQQLLKGMGPNPIK